MGIINVTPDSFYAESRNHNIEQVVRSAEQMISEGADILDIGGYSSRPGAKDISTHEEINRLIPAIGQIKTKFPNQIISVDTFRPAVAEQAILAGADMINDISGGRADEDIFKIAATHQTPICIMHMKGTPQNMQTHTNYNQIITELITYFSEQINRAKAAGVKDIIIDLGFGFSKTLDQNYQLIKALPQFQLFDLPILTGISRKSMLYKLLEIKPEEALNATTALHMSTLINGSSILRVHDVKPAVETIKVFNKIYS